MRAIAVVFLLSVSGCSGCEGPFSSDQVEACAEACGWRGVQEVTNMRCACQPSVHDAGVSK